MLTGTLAGQSVSVLLSPVLTRLFAPSEFGYLSVYSALLGILGVMASLGLDLAIPIAGTEIECANLMALCGFALVVTTAMTALLMLIPADLLADLSLGPLASYSYLVPIGFACLGGYYIMGELDANQEATKAIPIDATGSYVLRLALKGAENTNFKLELGGDAIAAK